MKRRDLLLLGAAAAASAPASFLACGPTPIGDRRRQLLESWGVNTLLPLYSECDAGFEALQEAAEQLCETATEASLEAVRAVWWDARAPWKQAELFAFGPYTEEPLRLGPKIDFWPARPSTVEGLLVGTAPLVGEGAVTLAAPQRGLPAIEYLIFQPDTDVAAAFVEEPRRCEYLLRLTSELRADLAALYEAWAPEQGNYLGELTEAGRTSRLYPSLQRALGEMVNRMGFLVEHIRKDKLGRPLGATSGGVPQPEMVESRFSARSVEDIRDNLRGVERAFFGDGARAELGLESYLIWRGRDLGPLVRARLDASHTALAAIEQPLANAVTNSERAVTRASDQLGELQRALLVDVLSALSLSVGFSGNDGD